MKKIFLLFWFLSNSVIAQTQSSALINFKNAKIVNDSLTYSDGIPFNEFNAVKTNLDFDLEYKFATFAEIFDNKNDKTETLYLKHWSSPINIYIDESIDKKIKTKLVDYIKQLSKLKIIEINVVTKKAPYNYIIETTNEKLEMKNSTKMAYPFYEGVSYKMNEDKNCKTLLCRLQINKNQVVDEELQFRKLKQYLFLTLGNFVAQFDLPSDSMLSIDYKTADKICDFDVAILTHHYNFYNKNKINVTTYTQIQSKLREDKNLKDGTKVKIKI